MNTTIEFINLAYAQLVFACLLNFTNFEYGTGGLTLSNILLILSFIIVLLFPLLTKCFLKFSYEDLSQRAVRRRYDAFYEHINIWD
jgi:hypothetical protein